MTRLTRPYKVIVKGGGFLPVLLAVLALLNALGLLSPTEAEAQCAQPANSTYCLGYPSTGTITFDPSTGAANYLPGNVTQDGATGVVITNVGSFSNRDVTIIVNSKLVNGTENYSVVGGAVNISGASPGLSEVFNNTIHITQTISGAGNAVVVGRTAIAGLAGSFPAAAVNGKSVNVWGNTILVDDVQVTGGADTVGDVTVNDRLIGGSSNVNHTGAGMSEVTANTVELHVTKAGSVFRVAGTIYGGVYNPGVAADYYIKRSAVTDNIVRIIDEDTADGTSSIVLGSNVIGGSSAGGLRTDVSFNMVEIDLKETSISIGENIFGGYLDEGDNATIQNNTVVINFGGTATFTGTDQKIAGALGTHSGGGVRNSTYEGNSATINGGTVNASVYGAINSFANAEAEANTYKGNQAVITGGTVRGDVVGASMAYYGRFEKGSPNKAEINAAENVSVDGNVYGVQIEYIGEAKFGLVNITGAAGKSVSITGDVAGAFVGSTTPTNIARASENTVNIDGSAAEIDITGSVLGGKVMASSGGGDTNAAAVNNVVNITGIKTADGDSLGDISGGYVGQTGTSVAGDTFFATGNRVNITDSDISSNVTGGYIYAIGAGGAGAYSATGNTVTLAGTVNVSGAPVLSGGLIDDAGSITGPEDAFTGNELVLNMAKVSGKFGTIQNFASYRFMVNTDDAAAPLLQTANLNLTDGTNNATMNISSVYGETVAIPGASVTLIQSDAAPTTTGTFSGTGTANHGTLFVYTYDLALDGNNVVATVASIGINAKSEGIVKTPLADVSFLNQGADQLADSAISAARTSLIGSQGYAVYGVLGYSKYRYETGSHVDVKGLTGQLGVSVGTDTGTTSGLGAVFFEFGRGTYDTYDEFPIVGEYHAYGDLTYVGGGVFGRLDLGSEFQSRPYFEASARLGKSWFNYQTDEFGDILVDNHEFNFDGKYYGFHAGAGYILNVDQLGTTFDLSSKFFYLEREAADHDFLGEHIHFDKTESSRLRTGGRVSIAVNDRIKPFVGGYYEYEFKGDAGVTIRNVQLAGDKLKGGSGIGELGVSLESLSTPIKFELGLQGSGGKRTGLGGTMSLSYAF